MLVLRDSVLVDSDGQSVSFRDTTGNTSSTSYGVGGNIDYLDVDAVVIEIGLSLIHISEPTRPCGTSRMPSSA